MVRNRTKVEEESLAGDPAAELVIAFGRAYHQSGVPVDELESAMHAAADAIGVELQVTAFPTSIIAALGPGNAQRVVLLRLEPGVVDLERLSLLGAVFRRIVERTMSTRAALGEIRRIDALAHVPSIPATLLAYGALSVGAAIVLGGGGREIAAAACIGVTMGGIAVLGRSFAPVERLFEVLAGVVATVVVTAFARFVGHLNVYVPIAAGVVQLLPGLQLTEALHELAYRNVVAGTARLGSAIMTLLSLGCGFALGIAVVGPGALHLDRMTVAPPSVWAIAIAVVAIASAVAVIQHARAADYPWVLGSCVAAEIAYRLFAALPGYQVATFGGALVVGVVSHVASRYARVPFTVLLIPGLLILVPGALSYESILLILQRDVADAGGIALNATVAAVEIVSGLLLSQLFFTPARRRPR